MWNTVSSEKHIKYQVNARDLLVEDKSAVYSFIFIKHIEAQKLSFTSISDTDTVKSVLYFMI